MHERSAVHVPTVIFEEHAPIAPIPVRELKKEATTISGMFAIQADWACPELIRFTKSVTKATKIGASLAVQNTAHETTGAMVQSKYLFHHKNLQMFLLFVFDVASALDGMANPGPSGRLTALLDDLRASAAT